MKRIDEIRNDQLNEVYYAMDPNADCDIKYLLQYINDIDDKRETAVRMLKQSDKRIQQLEKDVEFLQEPTDIVKCPECGNRQRRDSFQLCCGCKVNILSDEWMEDE